MGALLAFLRLSASPRVLSRPMPLAAAAAIARAWLELASTWVPQPTDSHAATLAGPLAPETRADLVPDAHLAALAIEHGLVLCSTDRDFTRFEGLRWTNPLAGG